MEKISKVVAPGVGLGVALAALLAVPAVRKGAAEGVRRLMHRARAGRGRRAPEDAACNSFQECTADTL